MSDISSSVKLMIDRLTLDDKNSLVQRLVISKFHDLIQKLFPTEEIEIILEDFDRHYAEKLIPEAIKDYKEGKIPSEHNGYYMDALLDSDFLDYDPEEDGDDIYYCDFLGPTTEDEKNLDWLGVEEPLFRKYLGRTKVRTFNSDFMKSKAATAALDFRRIHENPKWDVSEEEKEKILVAEGDKFDEEYEEEGKIDEEKINCDLQEDLLKLEKDFQKRRPRPSYYQKELEKAELEMVHCADVDKMVHLVGRKMYCEGEIRRIKMEAEEKFEKTADFDMDEYRRICYRTLDEFFPRE